MKKLIKNEGHNLNQPLYKIESVSKNDIAIIGIAGKFGKAEDIDEFWESLKAGENLFCKFPEKRRKKSEAYIEYKKKTRSYEGDFYFNDAAYLSRIDCFDYTLFNISPREAEQIDPQQRLLIQTVWESIEDAGYSKKRMAGTRTGVYVGHSSDFDEEYKMFSEILIERGYQTLAKSNIRSTIASRISYIFDLKGPSMIIDTACSSTLVAIHTACQAIRNGDCDMAISGGANVFILPNVDKNSLKNKGSLSFGAKAKIFDENSEGTGIGEGAGAVILKSLSKAIDDRDNIYAVIKGSAVNQNGTSGSFVVPNGDAQEDVIMNAWKASEIEPETISYIEVSGAGTKHGDQIEISAIKSAFERYTNRKQFCAISSVKTNIGHLYNATGICSLIKAIMALKHNLLPASLNFTSPNRLIEFANSPVYVNDRLSQWRKTDNPRRCGISSFGISGTNCHLILEEYTQNISNRSEVNSTRPHIMTISALDKESFERLINRYDEFLSKTDEQDIERICYIANAGRNHYGYRTAFVVETFCELKEKVKIIKEMTDKKDLKDITELSEYNKNALSAEAKELIQKNYPVLKRDILMQLCELYMNGAEINWEMLYDNHSIYKMSLPKYPFKKEHHWIIPYNGERFDVMLKGRKCKDYTNPEIRIANIIGNVLGVKEININVNLSELGLTSLMAMNVEVCSTKDNLNISANDLYLYKTIKELALAIEKNALVMCNKKNTEVRQTEKIVSNTVAGKYTCNATEKVIKNIQPFNEVFYRNCLYNSLFPIILSYQKSIIPYMTNDLPVYCIAEKGTIECIDIEYISKKSLEKVLKDEGINHLTWTSNDVINDIINSISEDKPVIIWVDCFYESIRTDLYQKQHWPHTLLVYGYNKMDKTFNIIEHDYKDNLSYEKKTISLLDINNSYNGFISNFSSIMSQPAFNQLSLIDNYKSDTVILETEFNEHYFNSKEQIYEGIKNLNKFFDNFNEMIICEESFFKFCEQLIDSLNNIINAKRAERYKILSLNGKLYAELIELIDRIIDNWSKIRRVIVKTFYSSKFDIQKHLELKDNYGEIYISEINFYNHMNKIIHSQISN